MTFVISLAERALIPDSLIRIGIRYIVGQRLREERRVSNADRQARLGALRESHIAAHTDNANQQHYEVATEFFRLVLGPRLKYSASLFDNATVSLAEAEEHTLQLYVERLELAAGHRVLDLGCGWGSFALWLAEHRPDVHVTAVSNSSTQRAHIEREARTKGIDNLQARVADVNALEFPVGSFDRIISIEMFEHLRNYAQLLERISTWLSPQGRLFVHIFCHRQYLYSYETAGASNWMAQNFFTGGLMPAADTLATFQEHLRLLDRQLYSGTHYARTARAWLSNLDARCAEVRGALVSTYGETDADLWVQRWRMFFMACEEMFAYDNGSQWQIGHYLFERR
ncbi:MAG: cyclopropane-fatty-acyl-phospholipid synthase family protein [Pseudomonadota bacterium]